MLMGRLEISLNYTILNILIFTVPLEVYQQKKYFLVIIRVWKIDSFLTPKADIVLIGHYWKLTEDLLKMKWNIRVHCREVFCKGG